MSKENPKVVQPTSIKKDEFQKGVSSNLSALRAHKQTLDSALSQLQSAANADAAFTTIEQVRELEAGISLAGKSAKELTRLLKLRLKTKMKEIG